MTIDEIYGFPHETSYGGGYGAKGRLEISVGGYKANANHYFTTGELFLFKEALVECYKSLSGIAVLDNTERELALSLEFFKTGRVIASGSFQERPDLRNKLEFEMNSDQTCVLSVLQELTTVQRLFGDMQEIR